MHCGRGSFISTAAHGLSFVKNGRTCFMGTEQPWPSKIGLMCTNPLCSGLCSGCVKVRYVVDHLLYRRSPVALKFKILAFIALSQVLLANNSNGTNLIDAGSRIQLLTCQIQQVSYFVLSSDLVCVGNILLFLTHDSISRQHTYINQPLCIAVVRRFYDFLALKQSIT